MLHSPWGRSPVSFNQISQTSFFSWQFLTSFGLIYSHLYCSLRDSGTDLPSSGEAAPFMRQVPCEFQADWLGCSFSGEQLRQGSFQRCPSQDGASSMADGSRHDLALLLTPVLLLKGMVVGNCHLQGGSSYHGAGPL